MKRLQLQIEDHGSINSRKNTEKATKEHRKSKAIGLSLGSPLGSEQHSVRLCHLPKLKQLVGFLEFTVGFRLIGITRHAVGARRSTTMKRWGVAKG